MLVDACCYWADPHERPSILGCTRLHTVHGCVCIARDLLWGPGGADGTQQREMRARSRAQEEGEARRERRETGRGSAAPDVQLLHRREAHQTGGEGGGAVRTDVIITAGERDRRSTKEEAGRNDVM
jgi:hypothetical protein